MAVKLIEYQNLSGESGIKSYAVGDDFIVVEFKQERGYRKSYVFYSYNDSKTGSDLVKEMKRLAQAGRGLNTYISKKVNYKYPYYKKGNSLESVIDAV